MNAQQNIDLLVKKYPWPDSAELFRAELEHLVALAERDAFKEFGEKLLNQK